MIDVDAFLLRALEAGVGTALVAGPVGCFIIWRRMAYFGDTMAHSALLGVAGGLALAVDPLLGVTLVCILIALLLVLLQRTRPWLPSDALLGILAHASLSFGMVAVGLMTWVRVDLLSYLFGDILAVTAGEVRIVWIGGIGMLLLLALLWRRLLAATVAEDLARAEGVPVGLVSLAFTLLIALLIGLAMKIVGILLITALLVIPAATARRFARAPEAMAVMAALLGAASVVGGLALSLRFDVPSGPAIVVAAALLFAVSQVRIGRGRGATDTGR